MEFLIAVGSSDSACDAEGMIVAGPILVGGAWVATGFVLGPPSAWPALRHPRRP